MGVNTGMYCLEVGQGSCIVLIDRVPGRPTESQAALVDVGGDGKQLSKWLDHYGVKRIVTIALTHHDDDHIRGLGQIVQAYKRRVDTVWILPDRIQHPKRLWLPTQKWRDDGWVRQIKRLEAPSVYSPGLGECITGPFATEYALYCIYPELFDVESIVHDAPRTGEPLGAGPNAISAVLRVAIPTAAPTSLDETHVLIGGDLDYLGWSHLVKTGHDLSAHVFVAPHHGGPGHASAAFQASDLVDAVRPSTALVSVGTEKNSGAKPYGHPHKTLIQALKNSGAHVMCTQITPQCVSNPAAVIRGGAVIPRDPSAPRLCNSGVGCAGTVVVRLTDTSRPDVARIPEHLSAIKLLQATGHSPLCR